MIDLTLKSDVRFGSETDICAAEAHVRCGSISGRHPLGLKEKGLPTVSDVASPSVIAGAESTLKIYSKPGVRLSVGEAKIRVGYAIELKRHQRISLSFRQREVFDRLRSIVGPVHCSSYHRSRAGYSFPILHLECFQTVADRLLACVK